MEPSVGIEPTTSSLPMTCSTTELQGRAFRISLSRVLLFVACLTYRIVRLAFSREDSKPCFQPILGFKWASASQAGRSHGLLSRALSYKTVENA